jgi:hypothetical protein
MIEYLPTPADMQVKVIQFITAWQQHAYPFNWFTSSVARVITAAPLRLVA